MKYRFEIDICFDLDKNHEEYKAWKDAEYDIYLMKNKYEDQLFDDREEIENVIKTRFRSYIEELELEPCDVELYNDGMEEYHAYEGYSYDGPNRISYTVYTYEDEN